MGGSGSRFSTYGTPQAANTFFGVGSGGAFDIWDSEIMDFERDSVIGYTGNDYKWMNKALRKDEFDQLDLFDQAKINNVEAALKQFDLTRSITVFRNSSDTLIGGFSTPDEINKYLKGAIVQDKGFMSTTVIKSTKTGFFGHIRYEVKVPKGKGRGAWVDPISEYSGIEHEFLLQRGTRFRVTGARYDDYGNTVVQLRVL